MPAILAHFDFGTKVVRKISGNPLQSIKENIDEYILGLQGPDILFFYKPYKKNNISKIGSDIHRQSGKLFFEEGKRLYSISKSESLRAYLLGCTCHYWLDKMLHPFVGEKAPEITQHYRIESEFDCFVSKESQLKYPRTKYLPKSLNSYKELCKIYNISANVFEAALKDFNLYSGLLDKKNLISNLENFFGIQKRFSYMSQPEEFIYGSETRKMYDMLKACVEPCTEKISMMYRYLSDSDYQLADFNENFEGEANEIN